MRRLHLAEQGFINLLKCKLLCFLGTATFQSPCCLYLGQARMTRVKPCVHFCTFGFRDVRSYREVSTEGNGDTDLSTVALVVERKLIY